MSEPGLDAAFLRYIGYDSKMQKEHQRSFVSFFEGCQRVIDLGCGYGDFVELLVEQGIAAVGVDSDPVSAEAARARHLNIVEQDVFAYLDQTREQSIDGVSAFHLVEHLPYEQVLRLCRLIYRALKPGGVVVFSTPDPHSLYAHLEMFYLHFGHVTFYDPRLLGFFLTQVGFEVKESGSHTSSVMPNRPLSGWTDLSPISTRLPIWRSDVFSRALRAVRIVFARVFLNPYLDLINSNFGRLQSLSSRLDRPFECYVCASKALEI